MPNHVKNIIKMKGIKNLPLFSMDDDGYESFDFNKLIPMPESLQLTSGSCESLAIAVALERIRKGLGRSGVKVEVGSYLHNDLEERVKSYLESEYNKENTEEELVELGMKYLTNAALYGATSWYDWSVKNWGTKWNAYYSSIISEDEIEFQTAWSAPTPILEKLGEMYPDIEIEHYWADEDMGNNSGYCWYHKGETSGGYDETDEEAYEHYVMCWGETNCLYKDEEGNWQRRSCEDCDGC